MTVSHKGLSLDHFSSSFNFLMQICYIRIKKQRWARDSMISHLKKADSIWWFILNITLHALEVIVSHLCTWISVKLEALKAIQHLLDKYILISAQHWKLWLYIHENAVSNSFKPNLSQKQLPVFINHWYIWSSYLIYLTWTGFHFSHFINNYSFKLQRYNFNKKKVQCIIPSLKGHYNQIFQLI